MMDSLEHSLLQNCSILLQPSRLLPIRRMAYAPRCPGDSLTTNQRFGYKVPPPDSPKRGQRQIITFVLTPTPDRR